MYKGWWGNEKDKREEESLDDSVYLVFYCICYSNSVRCIYKGNKSVSIVVVDCNDVSSCSTRHSCIRTAAKSSMANVFKMV